MQTFSKPISLAYHLHNGNDHFLQADAAVLKGVLVIIHVVVVVVRIA
jgi:hypothetical protein